VVLFPNSWAADYFPRTNAGVTLSSLPAGPGGN
jgi:hypothetical protein